MNSMATNVIHAADFSSPYAGNFMASLRALGEACAGQGGRMVLVLPPSAAGRPWCEQAIVAGQAVRFVSPTAPLLRRAAALASVAAAEHATILHSHFCAYDVAAWLAQLLLRLRGRRLRVVWHSHSEVPVRKTLPGRVRDFLKYRCMGRSVRMIAVSGHVREELIAAGFSAPRVRAILNGIDLDRATCAGRQKAEVLAGLGMGPDQRLLFMIGRDPLLKGVDFALAAVRELVEEGRRVVLGILGEEPLREYLDGQGIGESCPWVRVIAPTEDIASYYQAATVFLSASRTEGFSYAACEALANGIPLAAGDILGWASECPSARLCAAADGPALADAVRTILDWPEEECRRRCREGRDFIRRDFDVRHWAQQVADYYQEILGQP